MQGRLSLYKRLVNYENSETTGNIQEELINRFGKLPPQAQSLIEMHRLRVAVAPLGTRRIDAGADAATLQFISNPSVDAIKIIDLVQKNRQIKLVGQDRLYIEDIPAEFAALTRTTRHAIRQLARSGNVRRSGQGHHHERRRHPVLHPRLDNQARQFRYRQPRLQPGPDRDCVRLPAWRRSRIASAA